MSLTTPWYVVLWDLTDATGERAEMARSHGKRYAAVGFTYTLSDAKRVAGRDADMRVREVMRRVEVRDFDAMPMLYSEEELPGRWV